MLRVLIMLLVLLLVLLCNDFRNPTTTISRWPCTLRACFVHTLCMLCARSRDGMTRGYFWLLQRNHVTVCVLTPITLP